MNIVGSFMLDPPSHTIVVAGQYVGCLQVKADMRRFGMMKMDIDGEDTHIKKPTRFVTNSCGIADDLDNIFDERHTHCRLAAGTSQKQRISTRTSYARSYVGGSRRSLTQRKH